MQALPQDIAPKINHHRAFSAPKIDKNRDSAGQMLRKVSATRESPLRVWEGVLLVSVVVAALALTCIAYVLAFPERTVTHVVHQANSSSPTATAHRMDGMTSQGSCLMSDISDHSNVRVYSQNGEDGIIEAIFSCLGVTNKYYVEFGVEDCTECNTRFLRTFFGWQGLLMDGSHKVWSIAGVRPHKCVPMIMGTTAEELQT